MRAIKFSDDASWHVGPDPVPLADFTWPEFCHSRITHLIREGSSESVIKAVGIAG